MEECEWWLYPGIFSMVGLLIKLDPTLFVPMVEKVDHPVVQRWAAQCAAGHFIPADFKRPLEWVTDRSPDAAVALAIMHAVENIIHLDAESVETRDPARKTQISTRQVLISSPVCWTSLPQSNPLPPRSG